MDGEWLEGRWGTNIIEDSCDVADGNDRWNLYVVNVDGIGSGKRAHCSYRISHSDFSHHAADLARRCSCPSSTSRCTGTFLSPLLPLPRPQSQRQQQSSQNISQTVITSTSLSTFAALGPDRQVSTGTSTFVFTSTQILTPAPQPSSNGTVGNGTVSNGTVSGNNTVSANTTSTPRNLPTAPTDVNGGGAIAPSPGQSNTGGIFGPDDNYIAAASALKQNAFVVGFVGLALSGAMLVL